MAMELREVMTKKMTPYTVKCVVWMKVLVYLTYDKDGYLIEWEVRHSEAQSIAMEGGALPAKLLCAMHDCEFDRKPRKQKTPRRTSKEVGALSKVLERQAPRRR